MKARKEMKTSILTICMIAFASPVMAEVKLSNIDPGLAPLAADHPPNVLPAGIVPAQEGCVKREIETERFIIVPLEKLNRLAPECVGQIFVESGQTGSALRDKFDAEPCPSPAQPRICLS